MEALRRTPTFLLSHHAAAMCSVCCLPHLWQVRLYYRLFPLLNLGSSLFSLQDAFFSSLGRSHACH